MTTPPPRPAHSTKAEVVEALRDLAATYKANWKIRDAFALASRLPGPPEAQPLTDRELLMAYMRNGHSGDSHEILLLLGYPNMEKFWRAQDEALKKWRAHFDPLRNPYPPSGEPPSGVVGS